MKGCVNQTKYFAKTRQKSNISGLFLGIENKGHENVSFTGNSQFCGCHEESPCPVNPGCDAQECLTIEAADKLPIQSLKYGPVTLDSAFVTFGSIACQGQQQPLKKAMMSLRPKFKEDISFAVDSCTGISPNYEAKLIKFEHIHYNFGLGYNKDNGTFVAPVSGLYELEFLAQTDPDYAQIMPQAEVQFVLNGNPVLYTCRCNVDGSTGNVCTIMGKRFVGLRKGQDVSVFLNLGSLFAHCPSENRPTFSGKLIMPIEDEESEHFLL